MKNKYFRYVVLLVSILLVSCKKKEKIEVKGREYITESGFSVETSIEETKTIVTKPYDIKKHPEDWTMTNKETYKYILMALFDKNSKEYNYAYKNNYEKLPLSDYFRNKFDLNKYGLGLFSIEYEIEEGEDSAFDHISKFDASDEEYENNEVWCYRSDYVYYSQLKLKYYLDENNNLDDIEIIEPEVITKYIRENVDEKIEFDETFSDEETKIEGIKMLVQAEMDEFEIWKNYDWTSNFISNFDVAKGLIYGLDQYAVDEIESNELTDIDNKCIGLTIIMRDDTKLKYKIYFDVDVENKIDSITKVEEVLDDGTIIEVENNFGK